MSLNGQIDFVYYNHGDRSEQFNLYTLAGDASAFTGYGILAELGFRYDAVQPLIVVDYYKSTDGGWDTAAADGAGGQNDDLGSYTGVFGGINYYFLGHAYVLKLQAGGASASGGDWLPAVNLHAQLIF